MKRIKGLFMFVMASAMPLGAWADGNISGMVKGRETGEPIEFAVVQLVSEKTGNATSIGANTDENGQFVLENVPDGRYSVRITLIGSVPQSRPVEVKGANVDIGTVTLADDTKVLQEVTVQGVKGQMRFELDKKVFNVDSNIAAAGASASELLEAVPSVEVDQNGEISLRGNSSVTVWLNGKESGLTADNRAQILEQIPAETIDRIEVITNPSAKYSPEGTAGIINIILKKDRRGGYYGSAEVGANSYGGANISGNFNYNSPKWESFIGLGWRMRHNTGGSRSDREYDNDDFLRSSGDRANHGNNMFLRLGTTFHATDKDDLYVSAFGMLGHSWGRNTTDYTSNLPNQWIENCNVSRDRGDHRGGHIELGYTHKWSDTHALDINGAYNHWGGPRTNRYSQKQTWAPLLGSDKESVEDIFQKQENEVGVNNYEVKVDYTNQLNQWLKLESGYNGQFSKEDTPTTTWNGTSETNIAINEELYNRFIYKNNNHAAYFTLGGKVQNFSFSAGLRGEFWEVRTRSLKWGESVASVPEYYKKDFALFPSAFLSYSLPHDNELQINYTRRIRRPWGGMLNSFEDISNPTNISYGNPELAPQYANAFELNYIKSWTWHMISISGYLRTTEHDMNRISFLDGNVLYTTWANVGTTTNSGCEIVSKNTFFGNVLDLTTTVNLYDNRVAAWILNFMRGDKTFEVSGKSRHDFAWDARCMASVRLPWQLSMQATGRYNSRSLTAQGSREAGWSVDLGLRKILGNWSVSLNCRDIFDSRKWHSKTIGNGYVQENEMWRGGRQVQLTIKYSFGNMKAKPSKRNAMNQGEPMDGSGYGGDEM